MIIFISSPFYSMKQRVEASANTFAKMHPFLSFLGVFIGMPILTLGAVALCSFVVVFPVALIMGWI